VLLALIMGMAVLVWATGCATVRIPVPEVEYSAPGE